MNQRKTKKKLKQKPQQGSNQGKVNRKYKDALFRRVFKYKESLLELYNAINHTKYTNKDELIINTLDNFIFMMLGSKQWF